MYTNKDANKLTKMTYATYSLTKLCICANGY